MSEGERDRAELILIPLARNSRLRRAGARLAVFGDTQLGVEAADQLAAPAALRKGWAFNLTFRTVQ